MQTILNFKLETTNEKLTPRTGVVIFGEYLKGLDFKNIVNNPSFTLIVPSLS